MAAYVTKVFVQDPGDAPVVGALVAIVSMADGTVVMGVSDGTGKVEVPLEEGFYVVSASKNLYVSPASMQIEVAAPPSPTAAFFRPPNQATTQQYSGFRKNVKLGIDGAAPVLIDVTGGDNLVASFVELVSNLNTGLGAGIASVILDEIRLLSTTVGALSEILIVNDGTVPDPAMDLVWGLVLGDGDILINGQDTPGDFNDYDVELTPSSGFTSLDPERCVLWGEFFTNQPNVPLAGATLQFEVLARPSANDQGLDVADSFYRQTDVNGVASCELMRGVLVNIYLPWLDVVKTVVVPNAPSADLAALLTPYAVSADITRGVAFSMEVGQVLNPGVKAVFSDSSVKTIPTVTYTSLNSAVVTVTNGNLVAVASGTALVTGSFRNARGQLIITPQATVTVP